MADDVRLDISGDSGDAVGAIAQFKAALKSLNDETVKVTAKTKDQTKAAAAAGKTTKTLQAVTRGSAMELRGHTRATGGNAKAMRDLTKVMRSLATAMNTMNRLMAKNIDKTNDSMKSLRRTLRGLNNDLSKGVTITHRQVHTMRLVNGELKAQNKELKEAEKNWTRVLKPTAKVLDRLSGKSWIDFGRKGIRPLNLAIGAAITMVGMLGNQLISLTGLLGALPAALGGLGGMGAAIGLANFGDAKKALEDMEEIQRKLAASSKTGKERETELARAQDKRREIMMGLSKEQKQALPFFREWNKLSDEMSKTAAQSLAPALQSVGSILKEHRGLITSFIREGGKNVSAGASLAKRLFGTESAKQDLAALAGMASYMGRVFATSAVRITRALLAISAEARPLVAWMGGGIDDLSRRFQKWATSVEGRKSIARFFREAIDNARIFGSIIANLGRALKGIFDGLEPSGDGFLRWLDEVTDKFAKWSNSASGQGQMRSVMDGIATALRKIGETARDVWPAVQTFADAIRDVARIVGQMPFSDKFLQFLAYWKLGGGAIATNAFRFAGALDRMSKGSGALSRVALFMRGAGVWGVALGAAVTALYLLSQQASNLDKNLQAAKQSFQGLTDGIEGVREKANRRRDLLVDERDLKAQLRGINQQLTGVNRPGKKTVAYELLLINKERTLNSLRDVRRELKETDLSLTEMVNEARAQGDKFGGAAQKIVDEFDDMARRIGGGGKNPWAFMSKQSPALTLEKIVPAAKKAAEQLRGLQQQAKDAGNNKQADNLGKMAASFEKIAETDKSAKIETNAEAVSGQVSDLQTQLNDLRQVYTATINIEMIGDPTPSIGVGGAGDSDNTGGASKPPQSFRGPTAFVPSVGNAIEKQATAWWNFARAQQARLRSLRVILADRQGNLKDAIDAYNAKAKSFRPGGISDKERDVLGTLRDKVNLARDIRDRFRDAISDLIDKMKILQGREAYDRQMLVSQRKFAMATFDPNSGTSALARPFMKAMIDRTQTRLSTQLALLQKGGLSQGKVNAINQELIELTGALADLKQQAVDLSTAWLEVNTAFAQNTGQDMRAASIQMIQGIAEILRTGNFGLGLTAEQQADLLGQQRGAFGTYLAQLSTNYQLAKAEQDLGGLMGNFGSLTGADAGRRDFLWQALQANGVNLDGTFMGLSPEDRLSMFQELIGLLQQTADNTAETADNTEDTSAADEALRLLAIARAEGVMFTRQMDILERYLATQVGSFAAGTAMVTRGGTAQVHYGETIVSKHQSSGSAGSMEPVTLTIQGSDELTNALAKALTPSVNRTLGRSVRSRQRGGF